MWIHGLAAPYETPSVDDRRLVFARHAFGDPEPWTDVVLTSCHGKFAIANQGNYTLKLRTKHDGLYFAAEILSPDWREVIALGLRNRRLLGVSVEWRDREVSGRRIIRADLVHVSLQWPSYPPAFPCTWVCLGAGFMAGAA